MQKDLFVIRPIDITDRSVTIPHCYTVNAHCGKIDVLSPAGVCNGWLEVVFSPLVLLCDVAFSILYRRDDGFIVMIGIYIYKNLVVR